MKNKTFIPIVAGLLIILSAIIILLVYTLSNVSEKPKTQEYSYTTAICENGICQDYIIVCDNTEVISQTPITGAAIKTPINWQDPRNTELTAKFCNLSLEN